MSGEFLCGNPPESTYFSHDVIKRDLKDSPRRPVSQNFRHTLPSMSFLKFCQTQDVSLADVLLFSSHNDRSPPLPPPPHYHHQARKQLCSFTTVYNSSSSSSSSFSSCSPQQEDSDFSKRVNIEDDEEDANFFTNHLPYHTPTSFPEVSKLHLSGSKPHDGWWGMSDTTCDETSLFFNSFNDNSLSFKHPFSYTRSDDCSSSKYSLQTPSLESNGALKHRQGQTPLIPWVLRQNHDISSPSIETLPFINMTLNSPCESFLPFHGLSTDYSAIATSPNWESWSAPARVQTKVSSVHPLAYDKTPERGCTQNQDYVALTEPCYAFNILYYEAQKSTQPVSTAAETYSRVGSPTRDHEEDHHLITSQYNAMSSTSTTRSSSLCVPPNCFSASRATFQSSPRIQDSTATQHMTPFVQSPDEDISRSAKSNSKHIYTPIYSKVNRMQYSNPETNAKEEYQSRVSNKILDVEQSLGGQPSCDDYGADDEEAKTKKDTQTVDAKLRTPVENSSLLGCKSRAKKSADVDQLLLFLQTQDILLLARDQTGSRRLQSLLNPKNKEVVAYILSQTYSELTNLMTDLYGNYFCQVLFQACSSDQRILILEALAPNICLIASDPRGTHAMQAFILLVKSYQEQTLLIEHLHPNFLFLSTHSFGTHVIQQTITYFPFRVITVMFEHIIEHIGSLAENPHGVCVVKRGITTLANVASIYEEGYHLQTSLLEKLCLLASPLSQSAYGNYAIQHAIATWGPDQCKSILHQIQENVIELATQKFSSNVVEQMLNSIPREDVVEIMKKLSQQNNIQQLINSCYGSFVAKKAFERCPPHESRRLLPRWFDEVKRMQNRRLQVKWDKTLHALSVHLGLSHLENQEL